MAYASMNPATGEVVKTFETASDQAVEACLAASQSAFKNLRQWSFAERAKCMMAAGDIMESEAERLGGLMTLEMGKTLASAIGEARKCAWVCRYYAETAEAHMADDEIDVGEAKVFRKYLPIGPVLAVMPWNYPFWQVFRFAAPALMAGNTGILKHASNVPQCALAIADIFKRAGFPEGAFQTVLCSVPQVETMLRDDRVRAATLTGSEPAGASVAAICGSVIKPTVLELGGSDAFIVMPSADLDKAVSVGITARTQNCGQSCIAGKRFIVHADIYDEFKSRFVSGFEAIKVGDPLDPEMDQGPLVNRRSRDEILQQVENAVADGATLLTGGTAMDGPGFFFRPGILENVQRGSKAFHEEIFGPVALLFKVESLDEAIDLANDSPFGLGSAIFTNDAAEQLQAINEIEAGATFINGMTASDPRVPFGGIKRSGYGRELAAEGIRAFCNTKTVSVA